MPVLRVQSYLTMAVMKNDYENVSNNILHLLNSDPLLVFLCNQAVARQLAWVLVLPYLITEFSESGEYPLSITFIFSIYTLVAGLF